MQIVAPDTFEKAVIGCLTMLPADDAKTLAADVTPDLFHSPRNLRVYEILRESAMKGMPLGHDTAVASVKQSGSLEHFGSHEGAVESFMSDCVESADPVSSYCEYAHKLKLAHARKVLTQTLDESALKTASSESVEEAMEVALAGAMKAVSDLRTIGSQTGNTISELREAYMERYRSGDYVIPFPQPELNTVGGIRPGNIVVLGGYTGSGKSFAALDWITTWMREKSVLLYTLEMSKEECIERVLAMECGLDLSKLMQRNLPSSLIDDCLETLSAFPLEIRDGSLTVDKIISDHAAAGDNAPSIVVVDHMHLMGFGDDLRTGINDAMTRLKGWAVENKVIVVLLAQLSRPQEKKKLPRPTMYMFRESGAIEQIADYAIFVHSEMNDVYKGYGVTEQEETYLMYCEKQRNGQPSPTFEVKFKGYRFR